MSEAELTAPAGGIEKEAVSGAPAAAVIHVPGAVGSR